LTDDLPPGKVCPTFAIVSANACRQFFDAFGVLSAPTFWIEAHCASIQRHCASIQRQRRPATKWSTSAMDSSVIAFPERSVGIVSVSIDVDSASSADHDRMHSVCVELLDRFNKRGVAASWVLENPTGGPLIRQLGASRPRHEIALLAASEQPLGTETRGHFLQRIVRPIKQSAAAGIFISSIGLVGRWRPKHVDLLAKHGISVIRGSSRQASGQRIEPICYAVWHVPLAVDLRGGGWVSNHAQLRLARRALGLAMRESGFCHLRIDVAAIARGDLACSLRTVDRLLRDLAQIRDAGQIAIETLQGTAARLAPKRLLPAAQSILRAA
jgi:hypothetical protein